MKDTPLSEPLRFVSKRFKYKCSQLKSRYHFYRSINIDSLYCCIYSVETSKYCQYLDWFSCWSFATSDGLVCLYRNIRSRSFDTRRHFVLVAISAFQCFELELTCWLFKRCVLTRHWKKFWISVLTHFVDLAFIFNSFSVYFVCKLLYEVLRIKKFLIVEKP